MSKILANNIETGRGYFWKLVAVLWDEGILTMQKWVLGETVSIILQPTVLTVKSQNRKSLNNVNRKWLYHG